MRRAWLGVAIGLVLIGCAGAPPGSGSGPAVAPEDAAVHLDELTFENQGYRELYDALAAVADARTAGGPRAPLERVGNTVRARWCSSAVSEAACRGGGIGPNAPPGAVWCEVGTLNFPADWPKVFGLVASGGSASGADWAVDYAVALDGRTVAGTSLALTFHRGADKLLAGTEYAYSVGETRFRVPAGAGGESGVAAELDALRSSPESLRTTLDARLAALEGEVLRGIDAGEAQVCDRGEYHGDGVPPPCLPRALTPAETSQWRERARTDLEAQRALVGRDAAALHAALVAALPASVALPR